MIAENAMDTDPRTNTMCHSLDGSLLLMEDMILSYSSIIRPKLDEQSYAEDTFQNYLFPGVQQCGFDLT